VWIWESIKHLYAILAVVPVIPFLLIYFGYAAFTGDRKKAFRLAMDITTALLIGCVAVLFDSIFQSSFGLYGILLVMLIGGGLLGNVQYRTRGSVDVKRVVRAIWRLGFFLMGLFYVLLMCIGIGKSFFTI
jgi:undecaprenyl pyrophosphate phosphatase UppP